MFSKPVSDEVLYERPLPHLIGGHQPSAHGQNAGDLGSGVGVQLNRGLGVWLVIDLANDGAEPCDHLGCGSMAVSTILIAGICRVAVLG